jgi:multiple sugar transport system permease protein
VLTQDTVIVTLSPFCSHVIIGTAGGLRPGEDGVSGQGRFGVLFPVAEVRAGAIILLPLFVIYQSFGLYDTYIGLILVYQLITFPLMVWMMRSFLEDVPKELEEAVQIDGGSWFTSFRMIITRIACRGSRPAASCRSSTPGTTSSSRWCWPRRGPRS